MDETPADAGTDEPAQPEGRDEPTQAGRALARKLDLLFTTVHPPGRGPYSYVEVETELRKRGYDISGSYVQYLRTGKRDNPTLRHLEALAAFFGVPVDFFLNDDQTTEKIHEDLELVAKLRDAGVHSIALRAADLTPPNRQLLSQILDAMREQQRGGAAPD